MQKKPINKKIKIVEDTEDDSPEHSYVISPNLQRDQEKEEIRRIAAELKKNGKKIEPIIITSDGKVKKASELLLPEQEHEFIKCATNPIYFIETYLTIFDQTQGRGGEIVPFKLFEFQKKLIDSYQHERFVIANKYRQAGVSTTSCAYVAWYIMFNNNRTVAIVADRLDTARDELMNDVVDFINNCPEWLRPKTGKESEKNFKDTQKLKRYDNGSALGAFSAKGGLRGLSPTLLIWDETAWTEKGDKFWTAAYPTLQTGGNAIMVSCVTKDTYLYTNKGIKQIQDFIPNEELGAHDIEEYNVLGKDKLRKGSLFFNNGFVDTLKVKTTFSELESSYNHKYWAYKVNDKKYDWYKASELEVGDYVSIQYGMNIWGNNDDCSDFKPTISPYIKNVFNPTKITPDIAYLVGLYISEGFAKDKYSKGGVKTTVFTLTCGDSLHHVFQKLGFKYMFIGIQYTISSKNFGEFLKYLGFDLTKKAKEKIIPKKLLQMSSENIAALMQGIMDGDGWACYTEKTNTLNVGIALSSKVLIEQIRMIWSNFGVLCAHNERIVKPTERVKAESYTYSLNSHGNYAKTYLEKIGFRFERKQLRLQQYKFDQVKLFGANNDTIPNGGEILYDLYEKIKRKGLYDELSTYNVGIEKFVTERKYKEKPINRFFLLRLLKYINDQRDIIVDYKNIIAPNIIWSKIKSIEKSQNYTYDFSLPNDPNEEHDFDHSVVYNQFITHNTPNGLDAVYYKTFQGARKGENTFFAVEIWWFNDPRYNKHLVWLKNKKKQNEIRLPDEGWDEKKRIQMMDDGWEASSPWFEEQVQNANGDMRRIAQELLCVFGDAIITVRNKKTGIVENIEIKDFYSKLEVQNNSCEYL